MNLGLQAQKNLILGSTRQFTQRYAIGIKHFGLGSIRAFLKLAKGYWAYIIGFEPTKNKDQLFWSNFG